MNKLLVLSVLGVFLAIGAKMYFTRQRKRKKLGNDKPAMKIDPNYLEARHNKDVALGKLHKKIKWYTSNGKPVYE
jgi:hypothetical protein